LRHFDTGGTDRGDACCTAAFQGAASYARKLVTV